MPCGVVVSIGSRKLRKCAPFVLELLDHREQVADRAGEAVEPDDDEGFAGTNVAQQLRQHRTGTVCAGGVFLAHRLATGRPEFVELRIGALFLG